MNSLQKIVINVGICVLILAAFAGPLVLIKGSQFKAMKEANEHMTMPATVVTAAPAVSQTWENNLHATGSVVAVQGVTVAADLGGKVVKIEFEPGSTVKAGDLLVQIDTSVEEAQLQAALAAADLAKANLARAKELRESNTNSASELDAAAAQAKQALAQVANIRAVIAKKTIRAPFAGQLGLRLVNLGQILRDGDAITTLQTVDPIYVNFSLPQQDLSQIARDQSVKVEVDAAPGTVFTGSVNAISPEVDPTTRNVRVQATLANREGKLRAGMFANVDLVLPTKQDVLAIPATSILYAPYGDTVFVVEESKDDKTGATVKKLRQQIVRLGASRGDFVAVVEGLRPGEMVVTSGAFKLRAGMTVTIDNTLAPKAELNPKPKNA